MNERKNDAREKKLEKEDTCREERNKREKFHLKFKSPNEHLSIKEDIPLDFYEKGNEGDEPQIIEIHDIHENEKERGKCIVCYKSIYENDNDVFICPNCGREAHYLCATIFLTEHGICPVCSTRLMLDKKTGKYVVDKTPIKNK
ncbi:MAG: hypothetical protein ACTSVI_06725 [Promethearchaeota archaeon]